MPDKPALNDDYWSQRYLTEQTGWDIGYISTPIKEYVDQLENKNISILIPGCGNAYEAHYLWNQGFQNITLIDISSVLVERLQKEVTSTSIQVMHGDFFDHVGQYDLLLEQTLFCAIAPGMREKYIAQAASLLKPGGKLVGVLFNCHFDGGPPFGGTIEEYRPMFSRHFNILKMEPCYNSIEARSNREAFIICTPL
ncbi:MAG TPA: methyltransferase domain-containing protein [Phnomibacter sp.]|nr:methyltransferase domain-containing protein [Phnomibacter sp.]